MSRELLTMPAASVAETFPRGWGPVSDLAGVLASGRLQMVAIVLPGDTTFSSVTFMSGGTAATVPTHQIFGLFDSSRALLRSSADALTAAWSANTAKTLALASSYTTPAAGLFYVGLFVVATSVPTLLGFTGNLAINTLAPILSGTSNTGLTTALPATANAITPVAAKPYAYVS